MSGRPGIPANGVRCTGDWACEPGVPSHCACWWSDDTDSATCCGCSSNESWDEYVAAKLAAQEAEWAET